MSDTMLCKVCGGSESYIHDGIEYCQECSEQFKESREEASAEESFRKSSLLSSPIVKRKDEVKEKKKQYASWTMMDAYNLILSKQVSALIKLGCSETLKTVVLHIWARYLQLCQYSFRLDVYNENIPRLSAYAKKRDVQLLYGDGQIKKKKRRSCKKKNPRKKEKPINSQKENSMKLKKVREKEICSAKEATILSKKDFLHKEKSSHYDLTIEQNKCDNDSAISECSDATEDKSSNSSISSKDKAKQKNNPKFSTHAINLRKNKRKTKVIKTDTEEACIHHMTLSKTLSFCHLGLLYTEDQLLLSDLIRLAIEGKLPFIDVSHHFPPSMQLQEVDYFCFTRFDIPEKKKISLTSAKLIEFLGLPKFKHPPLLPIAARFAKDLNLPCDIIPAVKILIDKFEHSKDVWYTLKKHGLLYYPIPPYEDQAMSFLVVVLKMLLVFDGEFEREHSEIMSKINTIIKDKKLFIWTDWKRQTELKEYLFIKRGNTSSDLNAVDTLNADRIIGTNSFSHLKSTNDVKSSEESKITDSTKSVIKALLEPLVVIHDFKGRPTSFPLTYQLHRLMLEWKTLPMFKDTKEIDFSFINKDFSSHKLCYTPSAEKSGSEELINILLSSLYKSTDLLHMNLNASYFENIFKTSRNYWHGTHNLRTLDKKGRWLDDLPSTFKWLLKFLCNYLQINCADFYIEIRNIEKKLFNLKH